MTGKCEICILAGGLSSRMGHDKARLRVGGRSLLAHARALAARVRLPLRVIRRDLVPSCGPLGGVCTALRTTQAELVLFLACDMPFVSPSLLGRMLGRLSPKAAALFLSDGNGVGFPFLLRRETIATVERLLAERLHSLQLLAQRLNAEQMPWPRSKAPDLWNINTPADLAQARAHCRRANARNLAHRPQAAVRRAKPPCSLRQHP